MLIVFEGPDGAGKSSIAEGVQRKLNATRTHCGPPHPERAFEHWKQIIDLSFYDPTHSVVCDRLHWGDKVYADKYRPDTGPQLTESEFDFLNQRIYRAAGIIVHVTASPDELRRRFDGEYIDPEDIDRLVSAYEERVDRTNTYSSLEVITINTTEDFASRYEDIVDHVVQRAQAAHIDTFGEVQ